jgi:PAP2 superfamily
MSKRQQRPPGVAPILAIAGLFLGSSVASAQTTDNTVKATAPGSETDEDSGSGQTHGLLLDIKDYYTSPLRWDLKDWAYVGGAAGLFAVARHYDTQVRTHFIKQGAQPIGGSSKDLQDAIPAVAAVAGTWVYASFLDSTPGHREAWEMLEAGGLSTVTSYMFKFAAGRERPNQTDDPNRWGKGGSSFPSLHASAAVAIGTVLAESGNDDYRWVRRFLGYGAVAGYTAFERLKHNAHWLSDDVAGAALGAATAHFVLERDPAHRADQEARSALSVTPLPGGAMVSYNLILK